MRILISGGTGFIGRHLCRSLIQAGYEILVLSRSDGAPENETNPRFIHWNGDSGGGWQDQVGLVDAVVNLAGANIGSALWTKSTKQRILTSRVASGKALSDFICQQPSDRPRLFIQASAIGFYGTDIRNTMDESSPAGRDFLAGVAVDWENSSAGVEQCGISRAIIRTGVVLDSHEGALTRILLPYRLFVGGPIGSGRQWISWIHLHDEVRAIRFILENRLQGIFNLTSPEPVTNAVLGEQIAGILHRPDWLRVPPLALKLFLGEMSTLVLDGQKVLPKRLLEHGFTFEYPQIGPALQHILTSH